MKGATAYPLGTRVLMLDNKKVHGTIVAYRIDEALAYEVEWWEGGDVKTKAFRAFAVVPVDSAVEKTAIGFLR